MQNTRWGARWRLGRRVVARWTGDPVRRQRALAVASGSVALVFAIILGAWIAACAHGRCDATSSVLARLSLHERSEILAADGQVLSRLGVQRTVVPLDRISPAMQAAIVATEDRRFYRHHGVDYPRIFGALWANVVHFRYAEGFSTITMQLARNLWPDRLGGRERSLARKIREMQVAWGLEHHLTKSRILELYLNQIPLGGEVFGVEAAARNLFGKDAADLDVGEAALIAALPKAPTYYNPRRYPARALQRRNLVIDLMARSGYLDRRAADRWKARPIQLAPEVEGRTEAPWFVEHVRRIVEARFGDRIYTDGLRIYTTLDLRLQHEAEAALERQLTRIEGGRYGRYRRPSYADYLRAGRTEGGSSSSPYLQGMVLTLDASDGSIRAMVGGRDFTDNRFNRATQALRQPGSTFKPFVYSAALRQGAPLSRVVSDSEFVVTDVRADEPEWRPRNFDSVERESASLREGLYLSLNVVTARVGMDVGPRAMVEEARRFGITTPIPAVPSIALGTAEVLPIELVAAYTAFAANGWRSEPRAILRVEDRDGNIIWEPATRRHEVMDQAQAWLMTQALRDVVRRGTAYSAVTGQGFRQPAGGKTGTSDDYADVWFVGFTRDLVTGVWIGMDRRETIFPGAQGGRLAAPVWTAIMQQEYEGRDAPDWDQPSGITWVRIDRSTGYLARPECPEDEVSLAPFEQGTEPLAWCPLHEYPTPFQVIRAVRTGQ